MSDKEDYSKAAEPTAHKTTHQNDGTDEINVKGLSGELADEQKSSWAKVSGKDAIAESLLTTKGDMILRGATAAGRYAAGADGLILTAQGAGVAPIWEAPKAQAPDYVKVSDVKAYDVRGGTFTAGAWRTRDINTEDSDDSNICSIATNRITLEAGTYTCQISCPAFGVRSNAACLYSITDTEIVLLGTVENSHQSYLSSVRSFVVGKFAISVRTVFEIRHICLTTRADSGLGERLNIAGVDCVYTIAEFWRWSG